MRSLLLSSVLLLSCFSPFTLASNTSGVFGPVIDRQDTSAQFRIGYSPGEDGADDAFAYRFHYQRAISESFRWRVIAQARDKGDDLEYDYLRSELLWYLTPNSSGIYDTAVRFDIRTRKGSRPEQFSVNWSNQWAFKNGWRFRGILIGDWQFGGTAEGGMKFNSRASLTYKLAGGERVGIEMFNEYGFIDDIGSFNSQEHVIGPVVSGKLGTLSYQAGYLAGLTSETNDHTFRLWFGRKF